MLFKKGVDAAFVRHYVWFALGVAEAVSQVMGCGPVTITSLRDGKHGVDSRHYKGLAADIRTRHLTAAQQTEMVNTLKSYLDPLGFDIVLETDHIHCEFDPKAGEVFASTVA